MNSSGLRIVPFSSISFNRKRKAEVSTIIRSRRAEFFATYQHQDFSLPDSIMLYIAKNPSSPELYEKMVQTCKDFFVKNPILVTSKLAYSGDGKWQISLKRRPIDLSTISSKFWITDGFYVLPANSIDKKAVNQNILSSVMPKLYKCDAKSVTIEKQIISFNDLSLITSAERIRFDDVTVRNKDGSNVEIEKIVEAAVKAKVIEIRSTATFSIITSKLIKLPQLLKLDKLTLYCIPEAFDLETFYAYMKKNKTTKIWLSISSISEAYTNRLEEIVDEILAIGTYIYKTPNISFYGLGWEKAINFINCFILIELVVSITLFFFLLSKC